MSLQREFVEKQIEWLEGDGKKYATGEAFKPKRKRKKGDDGRNVKKRTNRGRSPERSPSVKDEEVSEYDADRTPPPAQMRKVTSPHKTRGSQRAVQDVRVL